jgi:hypothetical protein
MYKDSSTCIWYVTLVLFCGWELSPPWGDFSLFCLDSMQSTISAKSSRLCGDQVSLSDRPWMSSYIMQCVSWLWTVFWASSDYFPGELKWRWARNSILQVWSARNSNKLHGDLEQIANWVEAPRSSSKRPWSKAEIPSYTPNSESSAQLKTIKQDTMHWTEIVDACDLQTTMSK